jgi:hypothetical protein
MTSRPDLARTSAESSWPSREEARREKRDRRSGLVTEDVERDRVDEVVAEVLSLASPTYAFERLCQAAVEVLPVTGMGAMVMSGGQHRGTLYTSDARAHRMEDLQFTLGEGPCLDAYSARHPVLVADVAIHEAWPAFARAAAEAGLGAIFAFPLEAYEATVGAFNFYRDRPGSLEEDNVAAAQIFAELGARLVLDVVAERPPGWLPPPLERMMDERRQVYQATGMVAVQLQVGVDEALGYLRAHAWAHGLPLGEVSADVVQRRLAFDVTEPPDPGGQG